MDIEKMLTEVREAAQKEIEWMHNNHIHGLPTTRLEKSLASFTAEMPGAIGKQLRERDAALKHILQLDADLDEAISERDAALAKLEGE